MMRKIRERRRLQEKRRSHEYVAQENARNAARMVKSRAKLRRLGLCPSCRQPPLTGNVYCDECTDRAHGWTS